MNEQPRYSRLVLASSSTGRAELLRRFGQPFEQIAAHVDETPEPGEAPRTLVARLARKKAFAVAASQPDAIVIGSDQVAVFGDQATSKPGTRERACRMLARYSGGDVIFLTAVCVLGPEGRAENAFIDETVVSFRKLTAEEIERYVRRDDPVHCAGCFKVESLGPTLFRAVRSEDPTALQGLPLIRLAGVLRERGVPLP